MRVGINASFLRKRSTGIGQVTQHFLEELSRSADASLKSNKKSIEFIIYLEEELSSDIRVSSKFSVRAFLPFLWKRDDLIRRVLWERYALPRRVRKDGCDVLLSLYQSATIAPKGVKHIMVVHDIIPRFFPEYLNNARKKIYQNLVEKAVKNANTIVTVSVKTQKDLVANLGIAAKKIMVSAIDVDPIFKKSVSVKKASEVMAKYRLQPGYIYLGGGLEKRKNAQGLIRAYTLLVERSRKEGCIEAVPKLVISGKLMPDLAPLITDVTKLVKELNLSKRVKILGFVPQEDLPALYSQSLFFVFPSLYEGFGLPVLEAMSQGVPVLASGTTSLPEVGADAVMYCDPENIEDMATALKKMILDKKFRDTLGASGKERSLKFSWRKFVHKVCAAFSA